MALRWSRFCHIENAKPTTLGIDSFCRTSACIGFWCSFPILLAFMLEIIICILGFSWSLCFVPLIQSLGLFRILLFRISWMQHEPVPTTVVFFLPSCQKASQVISKLATWVRYCHSEVQIILINSILKIFSHNILHNLWGEPQRKYSFC